METTKKSRTYKPSVNPRKVIRVNGMSRNSRRDRYGNQRLGGHPVRRTWRFSP